MNLYLIKIYLFFIQKIIFNNIPHCPPSSEPSKQSFLLLHNMSTEIHVLLLSQVIFGYEQNIEDESSIS